MILPIKGKIQHYNWGGYEYLPHLLHQENKTKDPWAEYWLGAHPKAPSEINTGQEETRSLIDFLNDNPQRYLGSATVEKFGRLPYLFKILDVHDMLSIQVHPSKQEAEKGFRRENDLGIPIDAKDRNYRDDNHKPEMMVALTPFYLLHGFKEKGALMSSLRSVPEWKELEGVFWDGDYKELYSKVMKMSQEKVNQLLKPLMGRILPLYKAHQLDKRNPEYWAARAVVTGLSDAENPDRGIFSIFFFNIVYLREGEGIFQGAGIPHAYLEGINVELMANSDNVLRGGLTKKHVDVAELMNHISFEGVIPEIFKPDSADICFRYPVRVGDFYLERFHFKTEGEIFEGVAGSVEIILVLDGKMKISSKGGEEIILKKGEAVCITSGEGVRIVSLVESVAFKAGVPVEP